MYVANQSGDNAKMHREKAAGFRSEAQTALLLAQVLDGPQADKALKRAEALSREMDLELCAAQLSQESRDRASGRPSRVSLDSIPTQDGWTGFAEFLKTIAEQRSGRRFDDRLTRAMANQGTAGFLAPPEYAGGLLTVALESGLAARCQVVRTAAREVRFAGLDEHDHASPSLTTAWVGENQSITASTPEFYEQVLTPRKLVARWSQSLENAADSTVEHHQGLLAAVGQRMGFDLSAAIVRGTGAGQPKGVLNDDALITVSAAGGQAASTIVWQNVADMEARLHPAMDRGGIWLAHPSTRSQLLQLSMPVGTGGGPIPAMTYQTSGMTLCGRPVVWSEHCSQLGTAGDLILTNLSQYRIAMREDVLIDTSNSVSWSTGAVDYRAIIRADGAGAWRTVVTPAQGSSTLSWCVALATRS